VENLSPVENNRIFVGEPEEIQIGLVAKLRVRSSLLTHIGTGALLAISRKRSSLSRSSSFARVLSVMSIWAPTSRNGLPFSSRSICASQAIHRTWPSLGLTILYSVE